MVIEHHNDDVHGTALGSQCVLSDGLFVAPMLIMVTLAYETVGPS
jgi:hypothetical protein